MSANELQPDGRTFTPPTVETLARCDDEPIHRPGAVQPHGCLFEVRGEELVIGCVSSNLREVLGLGSRDALGKPLAEVFGAGIAGWAQRQLQTLAPAAHAARVVQTPQGKSGTVVVHHYLKRLFVEWLADTEHRYPVPDKMDEELSKTLASLDNTVSLEALMQRIAEGVKLATGYDRAMIYRFHPDWHGEIAAESTEPGLPPYRGLHYPASDIPSQARRLYVETRVRVISDVYARDAALMDALSDDVSDTLDLSHALLRSVSPVHIQYLRNMGTGATMVTSLLVRGRLWGLISCHHRARYAVPFYAFERLRRFTDEAAAAIGRRLQSLDAERKDRFARGREKLAKTMTQSPAASLSLLQEMMACDGILAYAGGNMLRVGSLPHGADELPQLVLAQPDDIGITDGIRERFPSASCDAGCAGVAWVVLSRPHQAVAVFVRPEFERTVTWGGDPDKAVVRDPVTKRLSPRGSFDLWKQTVSGRSRPWEGEIGELLEFFAAGLDVDTWLDYIGQHAA